MVGGGVLSTALVRQHQGGFLFFFQPQQVSDGNTEVLRNLVGRSGIQILLAAVLQIGEDSAAYAQVRAELTAGDTVLGAEGGDCGVEWIHVNIWCKTLAASSVNTSTLSL